MEDKKLTFMSHLVWYILCFGIIFFLGEFFYAVPVLHNGQEFFARTAITLLASLVLSVFAEMLVHKSLMLFIGNEQKAHEQIMQKLRQQGMSEELKSTIEERYRECRKKPEYYVDYCNVYAILLAAYYSEKKEHDTALAYIDSYDLNGVKQYAALDYYQKRLVEYYSMKLVVECAAGERERADKTAAEAKKALTSCAEKNGTSAMTEQALVYYDILCGEVEEALQHLERKTIPEYNRLELLARCYAKQGKPDRVNTLLEEMMSMADTDWKRDEVQRIRKELLGEK
ncbi:MAG: hypothetical protein NC300_00760 [Bacteroidales bacterium]|nr:hypothetical protein [Clostridium sp.]MCM1202655.1 hypothetical protein [Bacteroidales bacterium]